MCVYMRMCEFFTDAGVSVCICIWVDVRVTEVPSESSGHGGVSFQRHDKSQSSGIFGRVVLSSMTSGERRKKEKKHKNKEKRRSAGVVADLWVSRRECRRREIAQQSFVSSSSW